MFTLPHNTIARLYKQPVDMRLGMFRLQGLISSSSRHLHVRFTREVWEELAPVEVLANPGAYERIPEENPRTVIRVEVVPQHIVRHVYVLPAYRKIGKGGRGRDAAPIRAAAPATILPGSSIGNSVTAMAVYGKYGLKLPLYRQIREFERLGITGLGEGVLCNWVRAVAKALEPLWRCRHRELMEAPVLHVDETPVRCLKSDKANGNMWVMADAAEGRPLYYWGGGRSAGELDHLLREGMSPTGDTYKGTIVTDGYTAYDSWVADLPEADRPGRQICRAHVRRNFVRCAESSNDPEWSKGMVELIRPPYTLERLLREGNAPPGTVLALRQEISLKLVQDIFDRMEERLKSPGNPPLNALRRAIGYALERREILKSRLDNPDIPVDNNTAERAVRPVTVGRKNCLFIGAPEAGLRSAILYTMMEECKRCKVDGLAWLTWVLGKLPGYRGDMEELMPAAMPKAEEEVKTAQI